MPVFNLSKLMLGLQPVLGAYYGGVSLINSAPAALPGITEVWIYGASIEAGIVNAFNAAMQSYLKGVHGLDLKLVNKGSSGQTLSGVQTRWNNEKATIAGRSDILIVTMPIGNNISISRPWSTMTTAAKNSLIADYAAFLASVSNNGNIVMPVNTTFRDYDGVGATINNEANGSLPFNEAVIYPAAIAVTPIMAMNGTPFADPYNIARNWYSKVLMDDVHYTSDGYQLLRNYWLDSIAARVKGRPPILVPRVASPELHQTTTAKECFLYFVNSLGQQYFVSNTVYGAVVRLGTSTDVIAMQTVSGYEPTSVTSTCYNVGGGASNAGVLSTGNTSSTLLHDDVRDKPMVVSVTTATPVQKFSGYAPNQPVTVTFVACRSTTETNRWGEYSIDNFASFVEANAALVAGNEPLIHTITGAADSAGEFTFSVRCKAGSSYAYINGIRVIPG